MEKLPILTGEKVVLRPITDADTDNIVRWRNTPSVRDNFIFRQTFTPEMAPQLAENQGRHRRGRAVHHRG